MKRYKQASDIRVGVVGYGGAFNMGKAHLDEMRKAGMTPVAVAEIDPKRLETATADFPGIETYPSVDAMLKRSAVNLVTIITPHNTHAKLALRCLRAGRHVVTEKPFAITTAECDAMIAAAKRSRAMLSTYHNRHWDGCILNAMKLVRGGLIGDVFRIECHMGRRRQPGDWWRSSKSISGGVLYDWGVHLIEYALQLADDRVVEVAGYARTGYWAPHTRWKQDTNEDEGYLVARLAGGGWISLCITNLDSKPKEGQLEITGTRGTFVFSGSEWTAITHDGTNMVITKGASPDSEGWRFYQNVADHLVKGAKLVITPEWARRPIHILDLACRSARAGRGLKTLYQ